MLLAIYLAMLSLSTQERKINLQFLNRHLPYHEWTSGHNFQHQKHLKKKKTGYGDKLLQFLHLESQEFKVIFGYITNLGLIWVTSKRKKQTTFIAYM